jgi:putative hemolysin
VIGPWSDTLALIVVVVLITYVSLVVGELVPKRIALHAPERIAIVVARPMMVLAAVAAPVVTLLGASTDFVLRLLRANAKVEPPVSDDEIHALLKQGTEAGVFEPLEGRIVERLFRFADGRVADLMTPRHEIVWIDAGASEAHIREVIASRRYSRYVIARGGLDDVVGMAHASDLLLGSGGVDAAVVAPPLYLPESTSSLGVLERFRATGAHVALVVDEFGGIVGLVSVTDVLVALVGAMPTAGRPEEPSIVPRADGSFLVDGAIPVAELEEGLAALRGGDAEPFRLERKGGYRTLGGFLASELRRIPKVGDTLDHDRWRFEIVDMDGHRVDAVLLAERPMEAPSTEA